MNILNIFKKEKHPVVNGLFNVLLSTGFDGGFILDVVEDEGVIKANIVLPYQADLKDLKEILDNLKMEVRANDVKVGKIYGKKVEILFGMKNIENGKFPVNKDTIGKYIKKNTLKVLLPSSFGNLFLDFEDGASCHMLNGGMSRMGKTSLLLYLMTVLYIQNQDKIKFYVCSSKRKDFYPFYDFPVEFAKTPIELMELLKLLSDEYDKRNTLLESKALRKATDAKSVRKLYPNMYHHFKPVFVIIDEYADYSSIKEIQETVEDMVRKCGYVNIHFIIATQRADARTTIPAGIKCNLGARICFSTTDKNNSIVILDQEGAENLGKVQGRAIYLDGDLNIVQVPYLEAVDCDEILQPFRKGAMEYGTTGKDSQKGETDTNKDNTGSNDKALSNTLQNLLSKSVSPPSIQTEQQSNQCNQSSNETPCNGWYRLGGPKNKG